MKIIVTGGTGFIGSHTVVELHNAGHQPIIIDNLANSREDVLDGLERITGVRFPFYKADCNSEADMRYVLDIEKDIDGIIHFAADKAVGESVGSPLKYYANNIGSLVNLLQLMPDYDIKNIAFSSSCTVYGQPDTLPVTEESAVKPAESPYGNTKQICEEILKDTITSKAPINALALRYFNPIGAHPSAEIGELPIGVPANLVPFITQTAAGWRPSLAIYGNDYDTLDGTCVRDYIHVVDLAKAHVSAVALLAGKKDTGYYDFVNVGTGAGSTVLQVVNTFIEVSGVNLPFTIVPRRTGDVVKIYAKVDKSQQLLNWHTDLTLADALKDAWRWQLKLGQKPA